MVFGKGVTRNPSPYPRLLFHVIRIAQFFSAAVVTACLGFFIYYLLNDGYSVPWTFIVLLSVSGFTIISTVVTAFFYHYRVLRPKLSLFINAAITTIWIMGFVMLTHFIAATLTHRCEINYYWRSNTGVMVCRVYKAIESFTITAMLTTFFSLVLDIHTLRRANQRGTYNQMPGAARANEKHRHHQPDDDFSTRLMPEDTAAYGDHGHSRSISGSGPGIAVAPGGHDGEDMRRPYRTYEPMGSGKFNYSRPEEQTTYEGAGGRALDAAFARQGA